MHLRAPGPSLGHFPWTPWPPPGGEALGRWDLGGLLRARGVGGPPGTLPEVPSQLFQGGLEGGSGGRDRSCWGAGPRPESEIPPRALSFLCPIDGPDSEILRGCQCRLHPPRPTRCPSPCPAASYSRPFSEAPFSVTEALRGPEWPPGCAVGGASPLPPRPAGPRRSGATASGGCR